MKKDFNPIAITLDTDKQTKFRSDVRLKQRSINALYALVSKYVNIEDKNTLQGNFYAQFIELFLAKYQSQFPPISVAKMLEAMEVNTAKLEELTIQIASIDIKLDKDLNAVEPDFHIYTKSEDQNKLYKTLERISKDLSKLHTEHNIRLMPQGLQQGTSQALLYDWSNKTMKPNIRKVLGTERM